MLNNFLNKTDDILAKFFNKTFITRKKFIGLLNPDSSILEIGPFDKPFVDKNIYKNVLYADYLSSSELKKRAQKLYDKGAAYFPQNIPDIKFILSKTALADINEKFDYVFSSHLIEHQIDLVSHLRDVYSILNPNGKYMLIIPDKRFIFDCLLPETQISEIIERFYKKENKHSLKNVIEHRLMTVFKPLMFLKFYKYKSKNFFSRDSLNLAIKEYEDNNYIDVHSMQFTPDSFKYICEHLLHLRLIDFKIENIFKTNFSSFEFFVILKK
jgi:SAM-dependent methyltransferase